MNWINKVDKTYSDISKKKSNSNFIHTIPIIFPDTGEIVVYKNGDYLKRKSRMKILLCETGNRRIYFSDAEIIDIIVSSKYSNIFIDYLTELYNKKTRDKNFEIAGSTFGLKIPETFKFQHENKDIETKADFLISFNSLFVLVLLIIDKELLFRGEDFSNIQIKLFLILVSFYGLDKYRDELDRICYPTMVDNAVKAYGKLTFDERSKLKDSVNEIEL